jgi:hypothetical protein
MRIPSALVHEKAIVVNNIGVRLSDFGAIRVDVLEGKEYNPDTTGLDYVAGLLGVVFYTRHEEITKLRLSTQFGERVNHRLISGASSFVKDRGRVFALSSSDAVCSGFSEYPNSKDFSKRVLVYWPSKDEYPRQAKIGLYSVNTQIMRHVNDWCKKVNKHIAVHAALSDVPFYRNTNYWVSYTTAGKAFSAGDTPIEAANKIVEETLRDCSTLYPIRPRKIMQYAGITPYYSVSYLETR